MPLTRPDVKSDGVSLSHKLRGLDACFVPENSAINSRLSAVVNKSSPNKKSVGLSCSESDDFAGADELRSLAPVPIAIGAVVPLVHGKARFISVFREIPMEQCSSPTPQAWEPLQDGGGEFHV